MTKQEKKMSREATGLKHNIPCQFRIDKKIASTIFRRRRKLKMNLAEYMRYAVQAEQSWDNYLNSLGGEK